MPMSDQSSVEFRTFEVGELCSEKKAGSPEGALPTLFGYAAVYNQLSREMGPPGRKFKERILPGAFAEALKNNADIRALLNHNPDLIFGRTTSGTMRVRDDPAKGLYFEIDPANTAAGRDAVELVSRKDVDKMSFGFRNAKDRWVTENGQRIREITSADPFDLSPTAFEAYGGTSVALRSMVRSISRGEIKAEDIETRVMMEGYDSEQLASMARQALILGRAYFDALQDFTCAVNSLDDDAEYSDRDKAHIGNMLDQCDDTQEKMDDCRDACDGMFDDDDDAGDDDEDDIEDEDARSLVEAQRRRLLLAGADMPELVKDLKEPDGGSPEGELRADSGSAKASGKVTVNSAGAAAAHAAASAGDVEDGKWDFSAEDAKALLGKGGDDWEAFGRAHLGVDPSAAEKTMGRYKYPWGKLVGEKMKIFRGAVKAIESYAANPKNKARGVGKVASGLMAILNQKQKN